MTEVNVRIHTTDNQVFTATVTSSDPEHLTDEEIRNALMMTASQISTTYRGINMDALARGVDRIDIEERDGTVVRQMAYPSPSVFSGVARYFAPPGASGVASPPPAAGDGEPVMARTNWNFDGEFPVGDHRYRFWHTGTPGEPGYLRGRVRVDDPTVIQTTTLRPGAAGEADSWRPPAAGVVVPTTDHPPVVGNIVTVSAPALSRAIPDQITISAGANAASAVPVAYQLTPLPQVVIGGVTYDAYTASAGGNSVVVRRRHLADETSPEPNPWLIQRRTNPSDPNSPVTWAQIAPDHPANVGTFALQGENEGFGIYVSGEGADARQLFRSTDGLWYRREGASYVRADDPTMPAAPPPVVRPRVAVGGGRAPQRRASGGDIL